MAHVASLVHRNLEAVQDSRGHCPLLAAYVHYAFRLPGGDPGLPGGVPPEAVQAATLARGSSRPTSLYLARSKSISSSNPDLAVVPGSVDDEVSRILASKVGQRGPEASCLTGLAAGWVRGREAAGHCSEEGGPGHGATPRLCRAGRSPLFS